MKKTLLFCAMVSIAAISCKKNAEPTSSFSTAKSSYYLTEAVQFVNSSENADSFKWEFGDGASSSEQAPSHSYDEPGTYTVRLTASGKTTSERKIKVHPGTSSYQVVNGSDLPVNMVSFSVIGSDLVDLHEHGLLTAGSKSDTIYTSRDLVMLGGAIGEITFIVTSDFQLKPHDHTLVTLTNNSPIFTGANGQPTAAGIKLNLQQLTSGVRSGQSGGPLIKSLQK